MARWHFVNADYLWIEPMETPSPGIISCRAFGAVKVNEILALPDRLKNGRHIHEDNFQ